MDKITLTITFDQKNGQVTVNGPIQNRLLSFGLLKLAEKAIDEDHQRRKEAGEVVAVHGNGEDFLRTLRR